MYDHKRRPDQPGAGHATDAIGVPGRTTLTQQLGHGSPMREPLFASGATWEEIEPDELALSPEPPAAADDAEPEAHEAPAERAAGSVEPAAEPAAAAPATAAPVAAAARSQPKGVPGGYAGEHRKEIRSYPFRGKGPTITNTVGESFGKPDRDEPKVADGKISVDIATVVGGKASNNYQGGFVLVFHRRGGPVTKDNPKRHSGDHTGWVKVAQLPKVAQREIAAFQTTQRKELRIERKAPGHRAALDGKTYTFQISNNRLLVDKADPGHVDFRIGGGKSSTPLANYTLNPPTYGDIIVGCWNPPGSGAGSTAFIGSGGIRAFLPLGTTLYGCAVADHVVTEQQDRGTAKFMYVRAKVNHEDVFMWVLRTWTYTRADGSTASGANV